MRSHHITSTILDEKNRTLCYVLASGDTLPGDYQYFIDEKEHETMLWQFSQLEKTTDYATLPYDTVDIIVHDIDGLHGRQRQMTVGDEFLVNGVIAYLLRDDSITYFDVLRYDIVVVNRKNKVVKEFHSDRQAYPQHFVTFIIKDFDARRQRIFFAQILLKDGFENVIELRRKFPARPWQIAGNEDCCLNTN